MAAIVPARADSHRKKRVRRGNVNVLPDLLVGVLGKPGAVSRRIRVLSIAVNEGGEGVGSEEDREAGSTDC